MLQDPFGSVAAGGMGISNTGLNPHEAVEGALPADRGKMGGGGMNNDRVRLGEAGDPFLLVG